MSTELPVVAVASRIDQVLQEGNTLVVKAPPGAGKSTYLPVSILKGLGGSGKILMLEPRRIAARQVACRMAFLIGEQVGETVGYRVRFESRISSRTRIEVITDGILSRMLLEDPSLDGVDVVIFDEFHERSLESDEALALTRECQSVLRPDLKIVIMSATIDTEAVCSSLNAPLVSCEGRAFPVEIRYCDRDTEPGNCVEDMGREIVRALRHTDGDMLAFLPGESEIRRCARLLEGEVGEDVALCPLYGMLPFEQQNRVIAPSASGKRKVVLSTPIAETSLTIEGVRCVIDSGLCRTQLYDSKTGQSRLETIRISRDMANQRAGRAGRVAPGLCIRLYREKTFLGMKESRTPEILEADLMPLALDLAAWGVRDPSSLAWITPPPSWRMSDARAVLTSLGALDEGGRITASGRRLAKMPCHPRLARMMALASGNPRLSALAADLAAVMEDRDPMGGEDAGVDIDLRISELRRVRRSASGQRRWERVINSSKQFARLTGALEDNSEADWRQEGLLLAYAYPESVGKLNPEGCARFTLASGDQVVVDASDPLSVSDWIVAVSVNVAKGGVGRVFLSSAVDPKDLRKLAGATDKVVWDNRIGAVVSAREWRIGALLLDSKPLHDVPESLVAGVVCDAVRKQGVSMLDFNGQVANLQRRIAAVRSWRPETELPDLSTETVLESAPDWLPPYLGKNPSSADLKKIDLEKALWGILSYEQQSLVERIAPSHVTVPSGNSFRLEYRQGAQAPVLRVRLQECFGMSETPMVDGGRRPVLMELLSPGFKPVQLTSDLGSFWSDTYFEVRKELRRRYPKHFWPDDPLKVSRF